MRWCPQHHGCENLCICVLNMTAVKGSVMTQTCHSRAKHRRWHSESVEKGKGRDREVLKSSLSQKRSILWATAFPASRSTAVSHLPYCPALSLEDEKLTGTLQERVQRHMTGQWSLELEQGRNTAFPGHHVPLLMQTTAVSHYYQLWYNQPRDFKIK